MFNKSIKLLLALFFIISSSCKTRKIDNLSCRSNFIYENIFINLIEDGYRNIAIKVQYNNKIDSIVLCSECAYNIFQLKSKSYKKYVRTFHDKIYNDSPYQVDSLQFLEFSKYIIHNETVLDSIYYLGKSEFIKYCKKNNMKFSSKEIEYAIFLLYKITKVSHPIKSIVIR